MNEASEPSIREEEEEEEEAVENVEPIKKPAKSTETERRDVFCSPDKYEGRPFYLSYTGNPILVLDKKRVDYNDTASDVDTMMEGTDQPSNALNSNTVRKIGSILLQVAVKEVPVPEVVECDQDDIVTDVETDAAADSMQDNKNMPEEQPPSPIQDIEIEEREVFCNPTSGMPYYVSHTGNRVFVVDQGRINYLPGKDPATKREQRLLKEKREQEALELAEQKRKEMEEKAIAVAAITNGDDKRIGTIKVQVSKPPGSKQQAEAITRNVFQSSEPKAKPYYLTDTNNKIYVVDGSKIELDFPPKPKKKRRPYIF